MTPSPDPYTRLILPASNYFAGTGKKGPQKPDFCR